VNPLLDRDQGQIARFAADVRQGLGSRPRHLPSSFFYDDLGLALFEAICRLPWYRITRAETALVARHGAEILRAGPGAARIVELGSGSGEKLATLLRASRDPLVGLDVHLVDASSAALAASRRTLMEFPDLRVVPHERTYEAGLLEAYREPCRGRTLVLCLGSNIGNFDPPARAAFLNAARQSMSADDALLLGVDLEKAERDLLLAYDDPLGVTAAFNRNLLVRVNRELGGDFRVDRFAHRALWRAAEARVEMHLVSLDEQAVCVPAAGIDLVFSPGETIWTESSYKFTPDSVVAELETARFTAVRQWIDEEAGVALTLAAAGSR